MNPMLANLRSQRTTNNLSKLLDIKRLLAGQSPELLYNRMLQSNPQFAQFVQQVQNTSIEQIAAENNIDLTQLRELFR